VRLAPAVAALAAPGDLVITLGAGSIGGVAAQVVAELERLHVESQRILAQARTEAESILAATRSDANQFREELKQKAQAEAAAVKYNFTPAPRPQDLDEKAMRPEPGEIVSKNDYELNQAIAFLKSRTLAQAN